MRSAEREELERARSQVRPYLLCKYPLPNMSDITISKDIYRDRLSHCSRLCGCWRQAGAEMISFCSDEIYPTWCTD